MTILARNLSQTLRVEDHVSGVLSGNRSILARTITLVESTAPRHIPLAEQVVRQLLPYSGRSIRVGIAGVPGVGKSTFIESLGCLLCNMGRRVAVLAVEPRGTMPHGSILRNKTRMEMLSHEQNSFIRPSHSADAHGGAASKSRETIWICEAAGFDVVLVETVGVDRGELTVRSLVDFFLLMMDAEERNEPPGVKKEIVELADALIVTKADGDNKQRAEAARDELSSLLHHLNSPTPGWSPQAMTFSKSETRGIAEAWALVEQFRAATTNSGSFEQRRRSQTLDWIREITGETVG